MSLFYCMTSTGVRPPYFRHSTLKSAITEAKRLSNEFKCKVEILEVVGNVQWKDVPVVERKQVLELKPGINIDEDLPF